MSNLTITKYQAPFLQLVSINTSKNIQNPSNVNRVGFHTNNIRTLNTIYYNADYIDVLNKLESEKEKDIPKSEYVRLLTMILPYYFTTTMGFYYSPYQYYEANGIKHHPDYVVWKVDKSPGNVGGKVAKVIIIIARFDQSWDYVLNQAYYPCLTAKGSNGKIWVICEKALEICIFTFDWSRREHAKNVSDYFIPLKLEAWGLKDFNRDGIGYILDYYNDNLELKRINFKLDIYTHSMYLDKLIQLITIVDVDTSNAKHF